MATARAMSPQRGFMRAGLGFSSYVLGGLPECGAIGAGFGRYDAEEKFQASARTTVKNGYQWGVHVMTMCH